jgi:GT2 family glycosyltransferase
LKIAAVVVTYNRKKLLAECLDALLSETRPLDSIIVIDNASTDGTEEFLKKNYLHNPIFDYTRLAENIGGAGGFYKGVKRGYEQGFDWLWLMDDDTRPRADALQKIIDNGIDPGVAYSSVSISDTTETLSWGVVNSDENERWIKDLKDLPNKSFNTPGAPFNGFLISREIIRVAGLPDKEFLYGEDLEYSVRIRNLFWF